MGLKKWFSKPAKTGSIKYYIQTGETNPVKVMSETYNIKKQEYENNKQEGEKQVVGYWLLITSVLLGLSCLYFYPSNLFISLTAVVSSFFVLLFFIWVNLDIIREE